MIVARRVYAWIGIALGAALVGLLVEATKYVSTAHSHDEWEIVWMGIAAIASIATLGVLIVTAFFAGSLIGVTRDTASVTLTNEVLNADWMLRSFDAFNAYFGAHGNNLDLVRQHYNAAFTTQQITGLANPELSEMLKTLGAYFYLARLFPMKVMNNDLVIESYATSTVVWVYVFEEVIRHDINAGALEDSILDFARACLTRFKQRPERLLFFTMLRAWTLPKA